MKQGWTRLYRMFNSMGDMQHREARFQDLFLRHHQNADELICKTKSGEPLVAIYFTPLGKHQEDTKKFFREIQKRTLYAYEMEDDE